MTSKLSAIVVATAVLACSGDSPDAYIRFTTDGQRYSVPHAQLVMVTGPDPDRTFFGLAPDIVKVGVNDAPNAVVQWRMGSDQVEDLANREIDLSDVDDDILRPAIQFTLTNDVAMHPDRESTVIVRFGPVVGRYIEGSIEAKQLVWVSMTQGGIRRVDLSGTFRAQISAD